MELSMGYFSETNNGVMGLQCLGVSLFNRYTFGWVSLIAKIMSYIFIINIVKQSNINTCLSIYFSFSSSPALCHCLEEVWYPQWRISFVFLSLLHHVLHISFLLWLINLQWHTKMLEVSKLNKRQDYTCFCYIQLKHTFTDYLFAVESMLTAK